MHTSERRQAIIVLDYGSQYSRLITRRVRECHVYSELVPANTTLAQLQQNQHLDIKGFILSGGPSSVYDQDAPACDPAIIQSGLPILGICSQRSWAGMWLQLRVYASTVLLLLRCR
jgi:GMP synthase (glutamine-hydrolysing)